MTCTTCDFWRVVSALLPVGGQQAAPGVGRHQADFPIFSGQLDIFNFEIKMFFVNFHKTKIKGEYFRFRKIN